MKGQEEIPKWRNELYMHFTDPASVSNSWQWQGNNEAGGNQWDKLSFSDGNSSEEFGNIINWDDSAAQDAYFAAKERHEAAFKGLPYPVALPSPDLYIQHIDWDKREAYNIPDSADALSAKKDKGLNKRRGYNRIKGSSRDAGSLVRQETSKSYGWKKIKSENDPRSCLQEIIVNSEQEVPISWSDAIHVTDIHPTLPEFNLGHQMSTQAQLQGQSTSGWQGQSTQKGLREATYHPSVIQPNPAGWVQNSQAHLQDRPTNSGWQWQTQSTQNGSGHPSISDPIPPSGKVHYPQAHLQGQLTNFGWQWQAQPIQRSFGEAPYYPSVIHPIASPGSVHHLQAHCQGQSIDSGWQWQTQWIQKASGEPTYHASVNQPVPPSGRVYCSQTPVGIKSACTTGNHKLNPSFPGQWDERFLEQESSSRWDSHNLTSGQPLQHQVRFGDAPRAYAGTARSNKGWERSRQ